MVLSGSHARLVAGARKALRHVVLPWRVASAVHQKNLFASLQTTLVPPLTVVIAVVVGCAPS